MRSVSPVPDTIEDIDKYLLHHIRNQAIVSLSRKMNLHHEVGMHYEITRLSSKGQLVIPSHLRKQLGLKIGTRLAMFTDGEHILLKPIPTPDVSAFRKMAEEALKVAKKAKAKRKEAKS